MRQSRGSSFVSRSLAVALMVVGLGCGLSHAGEVNLEKYKSASDDNYPIDLETYKKLSEAYKSQNKTASSTPDKKYNYNPLARINTEGLKSFENVDGPQL